jgi:hypothetical protein
MPIIREWEWDDWNVDELARHGLSPRTVRQVGNEDPRFRRNKRNRAASHQMIGPDLGGKIWMVCIVRLAGMGDVWRAITGHEASDGEIEWYRRSK